MGPGPVRARLGGDAHADGRTDRSCRDSSCCLLAILALGVIGFQIGKAAILRSEAQTAADAAALAGAREIKRQLEVQWATYGTTDVTRSTGPRRGRGWPTTPSCNGAGSTPTSRPRSTAPTSSVWVETEDELGEDAEARSRPDARRGARARPALARRLAVQPRRGPPIPTGGTPRITDEEWDELAKEIGKPPLSCDDVVTLGLFLKSHGFMVWQNGDPRLGGDPGHYDKPPAGT